MHTERGWRIGLLTHLAGNGWEADYTKPAHTRTKRDATAQYNGDDDNAIQCCNALAPASLKKLRLFLF